MSKTESLHVSILYSRVASSHVTRNLPKIKYSKADLSKWLYSNGYKGLYKKWKRTGFRKGMSPSLDRLDTEQGYELNNLELVTWNVNQLRAYRDRKANVGRMAKDNEQVVQLTTNGEYVKEYGSVSEASRETGVNRGNISSSKDGRLKSAGGFLWVSKTEYEKNNISMEEAAWADW